jgi:hypothetical protein
MTLGEEVVVVIALHQPAHLPRCPIDKGAYERLYSFNQGLDNQVTESVNWHQSRVAPGLAEADVYRLLPSAPDFEYSGYLTGSLIRYFKGDVSSAGSLMSRACTFHSHPTKEPYLADIPSLMDIYSFLNYRHLRMITVGATKLWVWDKSKRTLQTVRRLANWKEKNHFRAVVRLMKKDFSSWQEKYHHQVMKALGWIWPKKLGELHEQWPKMLRDKFRIVVRIFPRDAGAETP